MANLKSTYLGVGIENPLVVGACALSRNVDMIKRIEEAGAGALVIKSLFEEQIQIERNRYDKNRSAYDDQFAEAVTLFPKLEHSGSREHVYWVKEARKAVRMPLFASLNCVNLETWVEYARQLEDTGVNALELNFYSPPLDTSISAGDIEKREVEVVARVRDAVKIPFAVKLHPYYTSLLNHVVNLEKAGASGFVLFNRLFQPDIDVNTENKLARVSLTEQRDSLVPLRWVALLRGRVASDLIASTGISSGYDIAKMILAGSNSVQVVSALYRMGLNEIQKMVVELEDWMTRHKYQSLEDFRGKAAKAKTADLWSFERGQYIKAVLGFE